MQGANIAVMNTYNTRVSELELTQNKSTDSSSSWVLMKIDDFYEEVVDGNYSSRQITVKLRSYRPAKGRKYFTISKSYKGEDEYWLLERALLRRLPEEEDYFDELRIRDYLDGSLIGHNVVATIKQGPNGLEVVDLSKIIWPIGDRSGVDYANDFTDQEIHDMQNPRICPAEAA